MSLFAIAMRAHPDFPVAILYNRDELHARPTAPAAWWHEDPNLLAGRDLTRGGTWFGVTRDGRFGVVTNVRDGATIDPNAPSRGQLPINYIQSGDEPVAHARRFIRAGGEFPPFNLVVGSPRQAFYASTRSRLPVELTQGVHTVSNGLLDERWPKNLQVDSLFGAYVKAAGGFSLLLDNYPPLPAAIEHWEVELPLPPPNPTLDDFANAAFTILGDSAVYSDGLPDTGVGEEEEERLSACFVLGPEHGTRSSTVFLMARDGRVRFEERCFDAVGNECGRVVEEWMVDAGVFSGNQNDKD